MNKLLAVSNNSEFYVGFAPLFAKRKITLKPAMSIQDALDMLNKDEYSAIVVDITLMDNPNIIRPLRHSSPIPIIAYSKEYNLENKLMSLIEGTDEYFVGSEDINIEDIIASVKALSRRYYEHSKHETTSLSSIMFNDVVICQNTRKVFINDVGIGLTKREFDIFYYLIKNKQKVLSYEQIFNEVWSGAFQKKHINAIRCQIYRLSAKVNSPQSPHDYILNIKDYGYQINSDLFLEKREDDYVAGSRTENGLLAILIGYGRGELILETCAAIQDLICLQADSIYDALRMIKSNEFAVVMMNSENNDYLPSLKLMREMTSAPILVSTNFYDIDEKIEAIDNGADGYMLISENIKENYETINALRRRWSEYNNREKRNRPSISFGEILLDLNAHKAIVSDHEVKLTNKEFNILKFILSKNGSIVTYEQICEYVWGDKYDYDTYKPLMRMIYKLKGKIKISSNTPEYILNVLGIGYRLNTEIDLYTHKLP